MNTSSDTPDVPFDRAFDFDRSTLVGTPGGSTTGSASLANTSLPDGDVELNLDPQWNVGVVDEPDPNRALVLPARLTVKAVRNPHRVAPWSSRGTDCRDLSSRRRRTASAVVGSRSARSLPALRLARCLSGSIEATPSISLFSVALPEDHASQRVPLTSGKVTGRCDVAVDQQIGPFAVKRRRAWSLLSPGVSAISAVIGPRQRHVGQCRDRAYR